MPNLSSFFANSQTVTLTAGEAIQVGDLVSLSTTDGRADWANDPSNTAIGDGANPFKSFRPFNEAITQMIAGSSTGSNVGLTSNGFLGGYVMFPFSNTTISPYRANSTDLVYSYTRTPDGYTALSYVVAGNTTLKRSPVNTAHISILDGLSNTISKTFRIFSNNSIILNSNSSISITSNDSALFVVASTADQTSNTLYYAAYTNSGSLLYSGASSNVRHIGWSYCAPTHDGNFLVITAPSTYATAAANTGIMLVVNSSGGIAISNTVSSFVNTSIFSRLTNYKLLPLANNRNFAFVQGAAVSSANSTVFTQQTPAIISITANSSTLLVTNTTPLTLPATAVTTVGNTAKYWAAMDAVAGLANDVYVALGMCTAFAHSTVANTNIGNTNTGVIYHINLSSNTFYSTNSTATFQGLATASVPPIGSTIKLVRTSGNNFATLSAISNGTPSDGSNYAATIASVVELYTDNGSAMLANTYQYTSDASSNSWTSPHVHYAAYDSYNDALKLYFNGTTTANGVLVYEEMTGDLYTGPYTNSYTFDTFTINPRTIIPLADTTVINTSNTTLYNSISNNAVQSYVGYSVICLTGLANQASIAIGMRSINATAIRFIPVGVATTAAAGAGNTVTVQVLGVANTRLSFSNVYVTNSAVSNATITLIGNTAIMR